MSLVLVGEYIDMLNMVKGAKQLNSCDIVAINGPDKMLIEDEGI